MQNLPIGVHIAPPTAAARVEGIVAAEAEGLDVAWVTVGPMAPDPFAVLGAAAARTERIALGTSIVPTFPRHPLVTAQGALAIDQLAPGRLRLGVGPSHGPTVEAYYGIPFMRPLAQLREYLVILRAVLSEGAVSFQGELLEAHVPGGSAHPALGVQILAAALRPRAFRLCGELTDGAISWMCPLPYIRDTAVPALAEGAQAVGRERPPLVVHVPVVVSEDRAAVRKAAGERYGTYQRLPFYRQMMLDAGMKDAAGDVFTGAMADALIISGSEEVVAARIRALRDFGASELLADICPVGDASSRTFDRTLQFLGELARAE